MDIKIKETYSEVYGILNILGQYYIEKLPENLYQIIYEEKLNNYNPAYDLNKDLESQNIKRETLAMITLFYLNYWGETEEEKKKFKKLKLFEFDGSIIDNIDAVKQLKTKVKVHYDSEYHEIY